MAVGGRVPKGDPGSAAVWTSIDGETWHRVRIGPFEGARKTEQVRGLLADNGIDTLIIKANP